MNEFLVGLQFGQLIVLFACGIVLFGSYRTLKRSSSIMQQQTELLKRQQGLIEEEDRYSQFLLGLITALQSGVVKPHNLYPVDYSNLPIEMRLKLWRALLAVGIELYGDSKR